MTEPGRDAAVALVHDLVAVPSLSGREENAATFLSDWMMRAGLVRSRVDEVGNAVGELGEVDARHTIVLLGHIDTVPGEIAVRIEERADGDVLHGRGSVDAKGSLATFAVAAARLGHDWAKAADLRLVVGGAVEEESATSRGARWIRDELSADDREPPAACVIGEPSGWSRVTLGYKGRLLVDLEASRPLTHTAGPDPGIGTAAVGMWNAVHEHCDEFNASLERAFDQLLPSLRRLETSSDGLTETVRASCGVRLPENFDPTPLQIAIESRLAARVGARAPEPPHLQPGSNEVASRFEGPDGVVELRYRGYEPAWRGDRRSRLTTAFRSAIRHIGGLEVRPGTVVKTGTSDMNVVGPAWRCPILAYGPGDSSLDHTPREHLPLEDYWKACRILEEAIRRVASVLD